MDTTQARKPRRPNRTVEEKLADYLQHKHEVEERARQRKQKKADHAHYLAAKKRKAKREREAKHQVVLQKRQDAAITKARKQEAVRQALEEKTYKGLSRWTKVYQLGFLDGKRAAESQVKA